MDERPGTERLEQLYLQAVKTLSEMEGSGEKFDLSGALQSYVQAPYIGSAFAVVIERDIERRERDAIVNYVGGVYTPHHHNLYFEGIGDDKLEMAEPTWGFVRLAAWAFLCAWTQRYGGLNERQRVSDTLIDPN